MLRRSLVRGMVDSEALCLNLDLVLSEDLLCRQDTPGESICLSPTFFLRWTPLMPLVCPREPISHRGEGSVPSLYLWPFVHALRMGRAHRAT